LVDNVALFRGHFHLLSLSRSFEGCDTGVQYDIPFQWSRLIDMRDTILALIHIFLWRTCESLKFIKRFIHDCLNAI